MQQQQQNRTLSQKVGIGIGFCQRLSLIMELWWRRWGTSGWNYFGGQVLVGLLIAFIGATLVQAHAVVAFIIVSTMMIAVHRVAYRIRGWRGEPTPHSRYAGESFFAGRGGNMRAIAVWEPLTTAVIGVLLMSQGQGWGGFLVILAVCSGVSGSYMRAEENARIRALRDARIEGAYYQSLSRQI